MPLNYSLPYCVGIWIETRKNTENIYIYVKVFPSETFVVLARVNVLFRPLFFKKVVYEIMYLEVDFRLDF